MKKYPKYQAVKAEVLETIPEDWKLKRLKYLVQGKLEYGANEIAESEDPDLPRYIRITDFGDDGKLRNDTFKSLPIEVAQEYLLHEGDILFARSGATVGKTFQFKNYDGQACFAGYLIRARPGSMINSDYLYYFTRSAVYENWKNSIFNQATIQNIGADKYNQLEVCVPSPREQNAIVAFLDTKTSQIDTLIRNKQKLIELLKEERAAIINHAVTKGIDPDAKVKESGVEWLGEIPAGWEVKKLKYVIDKIESGVSVNSYEYPCGDEEIGILKTSCVYNFTFEAHQNKKVLEEELNRVSCPVVAGTIIISRMNTTDLVGACGYVENDIPNLFLPDRLWQLYCRDLVVSGKWIYYLLISAKIRELISTLATGTSSSMKNISQDDLVNVAVPIPKLIEQEKIIAFIECEQKRIDLTIVKIKTEIDLLEEYRTALISEVVTGKVCVINESKNA